MTSGPPMSEQRLNLIMERIRPGKRPECFRLWACRGEHKGCTREQMRSKRGAGRHCADCVPADDMQETLEHLVDRLNRGEA